MKITMVLSGVEGSHCGVGDYAERLLEHLRPLEPETAPEIFAFHGWKSLWALRRAARRAPDAVWHLHYPSFGVGRTPAHGLTPLMAPGRAYLTLHEFEVFHWLRKLYMTPWALFGRGVIFSNHHEEAVFRKFFPFRRAKTFVVPIGSNIRPSAPLAPPRPRVVYFGHLAPNKGVVRYLAAIAKLRRRGFDFDAALIGALPAHAPDFCADMAALADELGVALRANLSADEVSRELAASTIAVQPYPDGVTDKRGSTLAALAHGLAVVTTHSDKTPDWLRAATHGVGFGAGAADEAADAVARILLGARPARPAPALAAAALAERAWPAIAARHLSIYADGRRAA